MSFRCEHCGFSNNEIQSAGSIRRMFNSDFYFPLDLIYEHSGGDHLYC